MDPRLKIVLILIILAVVGYWITTSDSKPGVQAEHYSAAFDPKFIDPRTGSSTYSKNVGFRPDEDMGSIDSTGKIFDHVADQALGVSQYADPDEGDYNKAGINDVMKKHVRFATLPVKYIANNPPPVNNVNHITSYQETDINVDRVNESNNIHNYCVHGNDKKSCCGDIDMGILDQSMESDDQYLDMNDHSPDKKTYVQIQDNDTMHQYDEIGTQKFQDINGLQAITQVINTYRNNALDSIRGDYRGIRTVCNGGSMVYDSVN
jgi:hypothetical protein